MKDALDQPLIVIAALIVVFAVPWALIPEVRDAAKDIILPLIGGLLTYVYGRQKTRTGSLP